jgi:hypothetical protein
MQTPEPMLPPRSAEQVESRQAARAAAPGYWGERLAWIAGLVLAISAFTDWYAGSQADGLTLSVTGWHTGALGKLVFFAGLATLILEALREAGIELPATVPESLVLIALGSLLSSRVLFSGMILALIVVGLTLIFGRVFCSWICPLGILNHVMSALPAILKKRQRMLSNEWRPIYQTKYYVLVALLTLAGCSRKRRTNSNLHAVEPRKERGFR